jgi:hypothetical protein
MTILPDEPAGDAPPELPLPETVLLWSMRTWAAGCRQNMPVARYIDPVFAELGAPEAPDHFYGLMWALCHGAARKIAVHCPYHSRVSDDEHTLLDLLALTQEKQAFERLLLLRSLLRPLSAGPVAQSASGLVRELNRAGLFLAAAFPPVRRHGLMQGASHSSPGPYRAATAG